jgi:aldose 1-epimerase
VSVSLLSYGATISSVKVPSKSTEPEEVTLFYSDFETLKAKSPYYGSTVGRVANRIAKGRFSVDGVTYQLATNNGPNHLHGGVVGYDKVIWNSELVVSPGKASVVFTYKSHDGEGGYPGNVDVTVVYSLSDANELGMEFSATTDKATPINLCNHTYWNLSGNLRSKITNHRLLLDCPFFILADSTLIPTGQVASVAGTPMDFTKPYSVGDRIMQVDGGGEPGYDHCFARAGLGQVPVNGFPLSRIALLEDPSSGRKMTVLTDQPGVQLYTGNFLSKDPSDGPHVQHGALCLETENYPDSVNQSGFPSAILRPGEVYRTSTIHKFEW